MSEVRIGDLGTVRVPTVAPEVQQLVDMVTDAVTEFAVRYGQDEQALPMVATVGAVLIDRMAALLVAWASEAEAPPAVFMGGVRQLADTFETTCLHIAAKTAPQLLSDPLFGTRPEGRA